MYEIGIFTPFSSIIKFYGGSEVFIKEVLSRLNKKLNILVIPTLNSIRNFATKENNEEICRTLSSMPFNFPQIVYKLCENNFNVDPEKIVYAYKEELKEVKSFYDINAFHEAIHTLPNWKIKLFLSLFGKDFAKYDYMYFPGSYYFSSVLQKPTMMTVHTDLRPYLASIKLIPYLVRIKKIHFTS
ncbi:hypothetical protein [Acidianus sp. RZ1]|uniref:hypothetical protein n=1 Tax=Acidianus sp. RZ1 TaxID=1540082 RepID=UPI001491ACC5|nr:hypothetical protein [Acidianus sp. RZ1]NON61879.1 hypothetical protein [Acidianus sp. RZ1]